MKKKTKKKTTKQTQQIRHQIRTDYLSKVYGKEFLKLIPKAVKKLRAIKRTHPFDAIAFTGSSGAALAYPMSYFLKLPLIHVRKGGSHYSGKIEGTISSKKYIIIDDFIDTGKTLLKIMKTIDEALEKKAKPVAICLYSSGRESDFSFNKKKIPVFTV